MAEQFKYPECQKGDCHVGEVLNLICMEPKCIEKSVICGICYDEDHKGHAIKPLKVIINSSRKYLEHLKPMNIDGDKIKDSVSKTKTKILNQFELFEAHVKESLACIRSSINAIFIKTIDQIELKSGKNGELLTALEEIKSKEIKIEDFMALMKKLLTGVPMNVEDEDQEVSNKDIEESVHRMEANIEKDLINREKSIKEQLKQFQEGLEKTADNLPLFESEIDFKFSPDLHHAGVIVANDTTIKSIEGYNYHFGLMEPSIQEKGNKPCKVAFKINENTSNWLAVGVCYKNMVQAGGFNFNYSSLGHGAYLVSSNGGSWSSIDVGKNNTVNAFSYSKGDIIVVSFEPDESKVVFSKKNSSESYMIEYEQKEDDELHLCGLFYYVNDEIEFLGYDTD